MILRYSPLVSRSTPNLLASAAKCKPPHSTRFFPTKPASLSSGIRSYATRRSSNESKDEASKTKKSTQKDAAARTQPVQSSKAGKPARGFEDLYTNSSLSMPPAHKNVNSGSDSAEQNTIVDGFTKLSPEQEKFLDDRLRMIVNNLPKSLADDISRAFAEIKKHGVPPELATVLKDLQDGKPMSLSMAARVIRLSNEFARKAAESNAAADKSSAQGKKEGPSASFFSQDKQDSKKAENKSNQEGQGWRMTGNLDTIITYAIAMFLLYMFAGGDMEKTKEITWQEFRASLLNKGLVEKLQVINNSRVKVYVHRDAVERAHPDSPAVNQNFFYTFTIGSTEGFERKLDEAQQELGIPNSEQIPVSYTTETSAIGTILSFAPTLLMVGFTVWLWRRASGGASGGGSSGIFGMGKTRAKKYSHETAVQVKFKDVAGADEAKQEIMEFVSFLKDPGRFEKLGAKIPRGAILSGPPGTGKTLLAKATAGESGVPFFSCSGSEFIEVFVGIGPSRVRDLFAQARKNTPCIIFIDEIDAIGKSRSKQSFGGGNDEREATLNQILTEMDGFNTTDQVVVLAGTNRPDVLDSALMRPGRFDRHIAIDRPTLSGRKQIFGVYLPKIRTDEDIDFLSGRLSSLTPGFSGADIANCVNEAALIAARLGAEKVVMNHFEQAIERTVAGLEKKSLVLDPEEKKVVAYHEAGHAICGWFFKHADPLLKVSIIPRGQGALGYAMNVPVDRYLMNVNQMMDRMAMILGGRVSEELHFETVTSGASDDFNKVTRMATAMVTKYGMSQKIGYLFYEDDDNKLHKPFSEETSRNIDLEVRRIVSEAYDQCKRLLTEKKKEVGLIAEELLSKEVLDRDDMIRLLGKRPWEDNKEFDKYFGARKSAPPPPPNETIIPHSEPSIPPQALPPNPDTPGTPAIYRRLE